MPQHFVAPPQWEWYIVWYFYLGGIAGGAYVVGTLLRLVGDRRDEPVARVAFVIAFLTMFLCPILLTIDLGRPLRFFHMFVDPGAPGLNFKYWSPMSMGAWALFFFGAFTTVSLVEVLALDGVLRQPFFQAFARGLRGGLGRLVMVVGSLFGVFLAGYTGVLLSATNQPVWSDTWALGGLFLASGLSVAVATIDLLARFRTDSARSEQKLWRADRYFIVLELVLLALFFVSLGALGERFLQVRWLVLWGVVLAGILVPLAIRLAAPAGRAVAVAASILVLLGGFALRVVVVFATQV
jgi:formate-dependent nitrite reductase membrane component NrfD